MEFNFLCVQFEILIVFMGSKTKLTVKSNCKGEVSSGHKHLGVFSLQRVFRNRRMDGNTEGASELLSSEGFTVGKINQLLVHEELKVRQNK